jgi:hypothetical protein
VSNHLTYDSLSREKAGNSEKNVAGSIPGRPNYPKLAKYACPE